ncbi:MAG: xylulokinase [Acidobacteriota bacterium]
MKLFLGLDISTTGAKALIIDETGNVISESTTSLTLANLRPLWSEQNPEDWWNAISESIKTCLAQKNILGEQIVSIGLTGQMHGLVLLDEKGEVLRPAILWNDQRCSDECEEIRQRLGRETLIQTTGNEALTGFTAPKILWVQNHEPEIYRRVKQILLPKDYVRYRLTGKFAMDKADGSGTILFDLKNRNWSEAVLKTLNIPSEWLPPTFEGHEITGEVSVDGAIATGLNAGTPVVAGGGDQAAQAVGVGAVQSGIVALTLGTSGVVFASTDAPFIEPEGRLHAFCHALPNRWHFMGVMLSAAGSFQWFKDTLASEVSFSELTERASEIPAGSDGLIFLPYLTGERTPHPDPFARGAWIGLTIRHHRAHLTRAVMEGVGFGLLDSFSLIKNAGLESIEQVRVSGGGAKSQLWQQILADLFGVELVKVNTTEGAAYGAALLAGVGSGFWADIQIACSETIKIIGKTEPNRKNETVYRELYGLYKNLYPILKPTFDGLSLLTH